jgi:hypothetical protein
VVATIAAWFAAIVGFFSFESKTIPTIAVECAPIVATLSAAMSNLHRLRTSDRIFFITTNLNQGERQFQDAEYQIILGTIASSRQRLGLSSLWLRVDARSLACAHLD